MKCAIVGTGILLAVNIARKMWTTGPPGAWPWHKYTKCLSAFCSRCVKNEKLISILSFSINYFPDETDEPWDLRNRSYQIQTRLPTGFPSLFLKVSRGQRHGRVNLSRKLSPHSQGKLCLCFQDTGHYNFLFILIFIMFSMTGKLVFHFPDFPHFQVSLISQRETLRGINKVHCLSKGWFLSDSESHPSDFCFLEK